MNKKRETTTEFIVNIQKVCLNGIKELCFEQVTEAFEVTREINPKTNQPQKLLSKVSIGKLIEPLVLPLNEVTPEKIDEYRRMKIPSFVLKFDGKLYHTVIREDISFDVFFILGRHQCSGGKSADICRRLSAACDEKGGCAKVRNGSKGIERYPWITKGYETFCTKRDVFVVTQCGQYEKSTIRKK